MMTRRQWTTSLSVALLAGLLSCGGGTPTGPSTGSLAVAVSGLPSGALAAVSISGPGAFARALTGSSTIGNLAPGRYTLTADIVSVNGNAYAPSPVSQAVTVVEGETPASASVVYDASAATLAVTITGLPAETAADVTVTGPAGFSQHLSASQTLTDLTPGTYTIAAAGVSNGTDDYTPNPPSQTAAVSAGASTGASVAYVAVVPGALDLRIDGVYLTQSAQTYAGTVPLVKGRIGYLRVFVTANQVNAAAPAVKVRLFNAGNLVQTYTISSPHLTTPLAPDEGTLTSSWNVPVPAALIQPNLSILAEVDPDNGVAESNEANNSFPASGTPLALDVRTASTFNVRFVPVTVAGRTGNVTNAIKDQFLTETAKMHPLSFIDADMHAAFLSSAPALSATDQSAWTQVLSELDLLRVNDGSSRYYFGVVNPSYSSGIAGIGYVPGKSAVGWDKLPSAASVAAHEWGHNWGRQHSPCGGASNPDINYPYADGSTGTYGLDVAAVVLKPPSYSDVMAYCDPEWISAYTYSGVLEYRQANPDVSTALSAAMQPCLLVWGRIENGQPVLEPAFEVVTRPSLPAGGGEYSVEGSTSDGSRVFSLAFTPSKIADVDESDGQFAFAIPMTSTRVAQLARLRLSGRGREAVSTSLTSVPGPGAASIAVSRAAGGRIALRWNAAAHPMLLVRDAATGQIISLARGGSAELPAGPTQLSVAFSNRVRSGEVRVAVPAR